METSFEVGQVVSLRADRARSGPVIAVLPAVGGLPRYRVFHSPTDIWDYDEDQLMGAAAPVGRGDLLEALERSEWLSPEIFRARLTAARLSHPQIDSLYALYAARIQFIPFQLKPLLRFLRADRPRLLIADEVGVGKTIEAGLILKELIARQDVQNVLVVCPKALTNKWRAEMRRFDEDFRVLTSEALRYCLEETYRDGGEWPLPYSRAIGSLELLRGEAYLNGVDGRRPRPGFRTLDPPPRFDLVIVDEAHHVRNPSTQSHELVELLCDLGEAVVFLSATPVHIGSANLFTLLNLLRPELFPDEAVFTEVLAPNQHLTMAMRHVRFRQPSDSWQADAVSELDQAASTEWGRNLLVRDPLFAGWRERLARGESLSDEERIRCLRDLEELHTLAQVMNRTRRRDIGAFTIRDPHTVRVAFTPAQEELYRELVSFRRDLLSLEHDPRTARLIADTLERQAASCLPGMVSLLDRVLSTRTLRIDEVSDDPENEEDDTRVDVPDSLVERAERLRRLAIELPEEDPKLNQLMAIASETLASDGPGKLLIFSYFLHTLDYLRAHLEKSRVRVGLVTGRIPDEEREHLRNRFRLPREAPEALDILLSSEVGCEGLDYEFCDRLVNYDIPWNPMRIEQRIGRIDRYGQKAEKVLIFNFITPNTVEERIYFRCFDRLGVFRATVGDLEDVLGDIVEELNRTLLDPALTEVQAKAKADQLADNAVRLLEEQRRLEEEGGNLIGLDQSYMDEVDRLLGEGKIVSPDDLRQMTSAYLAQPSLDGRIDDHSSGISRLRLRKEPRGELYSQLRALGKNDRQTSALARWLQSSEPFLPLTFDQQTAREQRDVPFITPVHPLSRLAITHWAEQAEPLVSSLAITDATLFPGRYMFVCDLWEAVSVKPEIRLVCLACDIVTGEIDEELSARLLSLLASGNESSEMLEINPATLRSRFAGLEEAARDRRLTELEELRERNGALVARKLASMDSYYRSRIDRVQSELDQTTDQRIERMKQSELQRVGTEYVRKRNEIEQRQEADIVARRIAAGILEVRRAE